MNRNVLSGLFLLTIGIILFIYTFHMQVSNFEYGIAEPTLYVRLWIGLLIVCSIILILSNIKIKNFTYNKKDSIPIINQKSVLAGITLSLYIYLLGKIGYPLSTLIYLIFTISIFSYYSIFLVTKKNKNFIIMYLGKIVILSIAVVITIHQLFTRVLKVILP